MSSVGKMLFPRSWNFLFSLLVLPLDVGGRVFVGRSPFHDAARSVAPTSPFHDAARSTVAPKIEENHLFSDEPDSSAFQDAASSPEELLLRAEDPNPSEADLNSLRREQSSSTVDEGTAALPPLADEGTTPPASGGRAAAPFLQTSSSSLQKVGARRRPHTVESRRALTVEDHDVHEVGALRVR